MKAKIALICPYCGITFQETQSQIQQRYGAPVYCKAVCGQAATGEKLKKDLIKTFWANVKKSETCWTWSARARSGGYGVLLGRRAHRLSWEIHNGPISDGLYVLHKCDNRSCVRPDHLFLGTHYDNIADCVSKKRHVHGEHCPAAKLTDKDIPVIRSKFKDGCAMRDLAKDFNVDVKTIWNVIRYKAWKHIP